MTARKTGPHLKRGPKPKPKRPKRSKGRPEVPLREHPDRYAVARFDVATSWWRICKGERMGGMTVHAMDLLRQGQRAAALRRAGERFRALARRHRQPDDMEWRKAIGRAVACTILTAAEPARSPTEFAIIRDQIIDDAASVGEAEWARRELLPLLMLRLPFKLEERDLLMVLASVIAWVGWATEIEEWMAAGDGDSDRVRLADVARFFPPA